MIELTVAQVATDPALRPIPILASMIVLAGCVSFFVGNSYQAQMPGFAQDLRHGDPGLAYTILLGANTLSASQPCLPQ